MRRCALRRSAVLSWLFSPLVRTPLRTYSGTASEIVLAAGYVVTAGGDADRLHAMILLGNRSQPAHPPARQRDMLALAKTAVAIISDHYGHKAFAVAVPMCRLFLATTPCKNRFSAGAGSRDRNRRDQLEAGSISQPRTPPSERCKAVLRIARLLRGFRVSDIDQRLPPDLSEPGPPTPNGPPSRQQGEGNFRMYENTWARGQSVHNRGRKKSTYRHIANR